jgi:hypothetical protein
MKALFGVVGLLVVLAIVGLIAARQLKSGTLTGGATSLAAGARAASVLDTAPGMTVQQTSQSAQQKVRDDVARALEQGAAARASGPDQ